MIREILPSYKLLILCTFFAFFCYNSPAMAADRSYLAEMNFQDDPFAEASYDVYDPGENYNRCALKFNKKMVKYSIKPAIRLYQGMTVDHGVRNSIANALYNLNEPLYTLNHALQGNIRGVMTSLGRFILNSTIGLLGFADFAKKHGAPRQKSTFVNTMAHYGITNCHYIMLPIIGPSSMPAAVGLAMDVMFYPLSAVLSTGQLFAIAGLDLLSTGVKNIDAFDEITKSEFDYEKIRSIYAQKNMRNCLSNGESEKVKDLPEN